MIKYPSRTYLKWFSFSLILLTMVLNSAGMAAAQEITPTPEPPPPGLAQPLGESSAEISYHPQTAKVNFIGASFEAPIQNPVNAGLDAAQGTQRMQAAGAPESAARAFLAENGHLFGLSDPASELVLLKETRPDERRSIVRFQQQYRGIPVMAGELVVQMDAAGNVVSASGEILPDINLSVQPAVGAADAAGAALAAVSGQYGLSPVDLNVEDKGLWIFSPALLGGPEGPPRLVWRMEVRLEGAPLYEIVLVDAQTGQIALQFSQAGAAKQLYTFDAENGTTLPGTYLCDEEDMACTGADDDALAAHNYASDFYDFFSTYHGRDSIDDAGLPLRSTVNYGTAGNPPASFENGAFWNGSQAIFGDASTSDGFYNSNGYSQADDIVAHEFVHGFTQYTSGLFNYYQSGAIAESLADMWGEFVDQTNGAGNDTGYEWKIGEDNPGGPVRDMKYPTTYNQPDKMTSSRYETATIDNGGIHTNSGINNKAVYLMVDGDTFNNYTVTGIGLAKVSAIYYEVQTNLLVSGSDYLDLHNLLYQGCQNLIGTSVYGGETISSGDCTQVRQATLAVEMNLHPTAAPTLPFAADPDLCPAGNQPDYIFQDDFESGASNWTFEIHSSPPGGSQQWSLNGYLENAHSGLNYLYADDSIASSSSYVMTTPSTPINIPADIANGAFLYFYHSLALADDLGYLEYQVNGGDWLTANTLPKINGYNGDSAYESTSHGYIGSRFDLSTLAGTNNVRFRWRLLTDGADYDQGWWLDDVTVYTCVASNPTVTVTIGGVLRGSYPMVPPSSEVAQYALDGGPVVIQSNNGRYIVASLNQWRRPTTTGGWTGVTQSMALPIELISNKYVIPRYNDFNDKTLYQAVLMANVDTVSRDITVKIGGTTMGTYTLGPSESRYEVYNIVGGPIVVSSVEGAKIVASLYELKRAGDTGQWNGQSEMMGVPQSMLSDKYLIPIYFGNWPTYLDASIVFANADTRSTTIEVYIGGELQESYPMPPNTSQVVRYALDGGPVEIRSDNGAKIVASLNQWRRPTTTGGWTGVTQSMALQYELISNKYFIPRYDDFNNKPIYQAVLMANVDTVSRDITVKIGSTTMGTYTLGPSESRYEVYNIVGGPIVVSSVAGAKIVASLYELKRAGDTGQWNGQSEMMGVPELLLSDTYLIPIYFGNWPTYLDASINIGVP